MNSQRRIVISMDDQKLRCFAGDSCLDEYPISTSRKGMGFQPGSYRTPTGNFRISGKIGHDQPWGTIFKARVPIGVWDGHDLEGDLILSRILRLDGCDAENRNTLERFIYIHGTNHESLLGRPASHGCIRMSNDDMIRLYDQVEEGCRVEILPATRGDAKLWFIDCDSTLSSIEGIDELARARGAEVFAQVEALTHAAMNGEVPISEVFPRRMEMIRPDRELARQIAQRYQETALPGVREWVDEMKAEGWTPVILSGGFAPLIEPLAADLGIEHIEAVPLSFHPDGSYAGYGTDYPTTRNLGKNEVIREWKAAMLPSVVVMTGDGVSDLETAPDVDLMIGFGGVVAREKVRNGAGFWLTDLRDRSAMWSAVKRLDRQD